MVWWSIAWRTSCQRFKADAPLTEEVVHPSFGGGVKLKHAALAQCVQRFARDQAFAFSDQSHRLLVKGLSLEQKLISSLLE